MTSASSARAFTVRHVQLARAAFAAIAAVMVTFSSDHSAVVGLSVFSGFAIATGLVHLLSSWLVYPAGLRWPSVLLGIVTLIAGMVGGLGPLRTITGFFAIVIAWALVSGAIEAISGILAVRTPRVKAGQVAPWTDGSAPTVMPRSDARDAIVVGVISVVLGLALLVIQPAYALDYTIDDANRTYTLTGIIIAVGVFGGYASVLAVYLGIAGFSPGRPQLTAETATAETKDHA